MYIFRESFASKYTKIRNANDKIIADKRHKYFLIYLVINSITVEKIDEERPQRQNHMPILSIPNAQPIYDFDKSTTKKTLKNAINASNGNNNHVFNHANNLKVLATVSIKVSVMFDFL